MKQYKPHRQIRTSKRVSSETGVAIAASIGEPGPTRYGQAKEEIMTVMRRLPPVQRRAMITDIMREVLER